MSKKEALSKGPKRDENRTLKRMVIVWGTQHSVIKKNAHVPL